MSGIFRGVGNRGGVRGGKDRTYILENLFLFEQLINVR